jgi:putative flippase GtrA
VEKIRELIKKYLTKEIILYIILGVCTTAVNFISFYIMTTFFKWSDNISNFIAIILAVLFAYFSNKDIVFHSKAKNIKEKLNEFLKFIAGRAVTMGIEFFGGMLLFTLPIMPIISKCIISVIVVILNYVISKIFTFK